MTNGAKQRGQGATIEADGDRFRLGHPGATMWRCCSKGTGVACSCSRRPAVSSRHSFKGWVPERSIASNFPTGSRSRIRPRVSSRRTCTAPARSLTRTATSGRKVGGRPWDEAVSTNCSRRVHAGGNISRSHRQAGSSRRPRRHGDRDHAGRGFSGRRNWGYDGVLPYAPDASYGRPEDLKALVDAAHAVASMVLLDVVYNHFGPDGNYLPVYAPRFFTDRHKTPWGAAINYDGRNAEPVREFFIHNALYWIEEFHLDGLRLDAVHAILDDSPNICWMSSRSASAPRTAAAVPPASWRMRRTIRACCCDASGAAALLHRAVE